MSTIYFICNEDKKEEMKEKCFDIIHSHYFSTVSPSSHAVYEDEGEEVYSERLKTVMKEMLCSTEDTDDGFSFTFDSTEDAGFTIADVVYGTGMGYSDNGLTTLHDIFENIVDEFPDVCFEADCICEDKWYSEEYHCSYDGKELTSDCEGIV